MPAIAADRSELEQPVLDPTADLSSLTNSEIDEAAESYSRWSKKYKPS